MRRVSAATDRSQGGPGPDARTRALMSEYALRASQLPPGSTSHTGHGRPHVRGGEGAGVRAHEVPRPPAQQTPPSCTMRPPVHLSTHLDAMEDTVTGVWGPIGFFDLEEEDLFGFLRVLRRFYKHTFANPSATGHSGSDADAAADDALLVRNGLWLALSNAVFYAVTVLDPRRLRGPPAPGPAVKTAGRAGAYTVVYGSSSEDGEGPAPGGVTTYYTTPFVPAPLRWRRRPGRDASNGGDGRAHTGVGAAAAAAAAAPMNGSALSADGEGVAAGSLARLQERLTELPIEDWYLTLRCLAQVGYRRDELYTQSPSQGSPHELMLALLWLTRTYELAAVVEYIDLNTNYGFLLKYHSEMSGATPGASRIDGPTSSLLESFGQADVWPPSGFDEAAAMAARLGQIDRTLGGERGLGCGDGAGAEEGASDRSGPPSRTAAGPPPSHRPRPPRSAGVTAPTPERASVTARRLMALQRLVQLSLNRLQHALEQRVDQASALGLHSPYDVQLCQRAHHEGYVRVLEGLGHVAKMRERVRVRLDSIAGCGLLVAHALRRVPPLTTEDEVLAGMREDDCTWLSDRAEGGEDEDTCDAVNAASETMESILGRFRATRTRPYLLDRWRTMVRQAHTSPTAATGAEAGRRTPFVLNGKDQYREECRVHNDVIRRYSLQSALAAEVVALRFPQSAGPAAPAPQPRGAGEGPAGVTTLALVPLMLRSLAGGALGGPTDTRVVQVTEVGPPVAGATTSARLELARLTGLLREVEDSVRAERQQGQRVAHCQEMLRRLYDVHRLRLAVGCTRKRKPSPPPPPPLASKQHRPVSRSNGKGPL